MPSGKTHLRIEACGLLACTGLGALFLRRGLIDAPTMISFCGAYAISMMLLSPDLDLNDSRASRRWGPLRIFWLPYAALFKHRQLSHHLLLGPLMRILYLLALLLASAFLVVLATRRSLRIPFPSGTLVAAVFAGLYLPNVTHILVDRAHTLRRKRRFPRRL
jgi:uncharacterized metal-binding protein